MNRERGSGNVMPCEETRRRVRTLSTAIRIARARHACSHVLPSGEHVAAWSQQQREESGLKNVQAHLPTAAPFQGVEEKRVDALRVAIHLLKAKSGSMTSCSVHSKTSPLTLPLQPFPPHYPPSLRSLIKTKQRRGLSSCVHHHHFSCCL